MKKMINPRKFLITSVIPILCTLLALAAASFAWLSSNKQNDADGMQMKVQVTPNMIINDDSTAIQAVTAPTQDDFTVTFTDAAAAKQPAQHDAADTADKATDWTYSSGLKYVTDPDNVDVSTGLEKSGSLSFALANTDDFYVDYTVYIASTGAEMTAQDLTATLSGSIDGDGANKADTLAASSIDFYLGSVAKANYLGTLNQAGKDALTNDASTAKTFVTVLENGTIPLNTSSYITVVMRCYIDGGLLKAANQAYINSEKVDLSDVTLNVTFTASNH